MKKITEEKLVEQTTERIAKQLQSFQERNTIQDKLDKKKTDKTDYSILLLDIDDVSQQFEELASETLGLLNALIEIREKQPEIKSLIGIKRRVDKKILDLDLLLNTIDKAGSSRVITLPPVLSRWLREIKSVKAK